MDFTSMFKKHSVARAKPKTRQQLQKQQQQRKQKQEMDKFMQNTMVTLPVHHDFRNFYAKHGIKKYKLTQKQQQQQQQMQQRIQELGQQIQEREKIIVDSILSRHPDDILDYEPAQVYKIVLLLLFSDLRKIKRDHIMFMKPYVEDIEATYTIRNKEEVFEGKKWSDIMKRVQAYNAKFQRLYAQQLAGK